MLPSSCFLLSRFPALPWFPYLWRMFGRLFLVTSFPSYSWYWEYGFCGTACNSTFKPPSTLSSSSCGRMERFFVLVLFGKCELPGSCVHLPFWLMSQELPETESPAGFAALEGSARFTGRAHKRRRPKNRSSNSQRPPLWSSHPRRLLRVFFFFCRYPLGCHRRSLRSGVRCRVAHRGYDVHACARSQDSRGVQGSHF